MGSNATPSSAPPSLHTTDKYIFFYGYELQIPELTFQNWYPAVFEEPSPKLGQPPNRFPTGEHYIMYHKALLMHDTDTAALVLRAATPAEANRLGRGVKNYDGKLWRAERDGVAERLTYLKFSQVEECRRALLGSGEKEIAEASPQDRVWGIGFRGDEAEGREDEWGENVAGKALMKVRERLRREGWGVDGKESASAEKM